MERKKERGLIHKAVEWCKDLNMRVILDFHILRSHYFNDTENVTLWSSKAEQDKYPICGKNCRRI